MQSLASVGCRRTRPRGSSQRVGGERVGPAGAAGERAFPLSLASGARRVGGGRCVSRGGRRGSEVREVPVLRVPSARASIAGTESARQCFRQPCFLTHASRTHARAHTRHATHVPREIYARDPARGQPGCTNARAKVQHIRTHEPRGQPDVRPDVRRAEQRPLLR